MASTDCNHGPELSELRALLTGALGELATLRDEVAALRTENLQLKADNAELRARLNQNSQNSSKPPSSDGPQVQRPEKKPSTRHRGGQPGGKGAKRVRLPPDRVINHRPTKCRFCQEHLSGDDAEPKWFQVFELPEIKPTVTEHRGHALTCTHCGTRNEASIPEAVLQHGFGPRLSAFVAYLTGRCRLSKRQVTELFEEALGTPLSTGAVCAIEQDVSEALATPFEEAKAAIRKQPVVHVDETGWREDKQRAWLWTAVSGAAIVFHVTCSRGGDVVRALLGETFSGHLVTDRWSAYNWVDARRRQLCWSHLLRDLQGMVERGGRGEVFARAILACARDMFEWWAQVRDGELERTQFQERMRSVRTEVERLLMQSAMHAEEKTAGMCAEILKLKEALWTFVDVEGIEPTNNAAERALRPAVLQRKGSFGNDSERGARYCERVLTTVATVRLRGGRVLKYLAEACAEYRQSGTAPSLLTIGTAA